MPDSGPSKGYDESFHRLIRLQGVDPAFFILAVHSFIEGILRERFSQGDLADDHFSTLLSEFEQWIRSQSTTYIPGLESLSLLKVQHILADETRHQFASANAEDARAATQHLRRFCTLAGIPQGEKCQILLDFLHGWNDRESRAPLTRESVRRSRLRGDRALEMTRRVSELEAVQARAAELKDRLLSTDRDLAQTSLGTGRMEQSVAGLLEERKDLVRRLRSAQARIRSLSDAQAYMDSLSRMTVLARTRQDYEQSCIRLTPEQRSVLDQIRMDSDFLIRGTAGTGKTLILLKAIEKAQGRGEQPTLEMNELGTKVILLTYGRTLAEYDKYLTSIFSGNDGFRFIHTAEGFIRERLSALEPDARIDDEAGHRFAVQFTPPGMAPRDFLLETERFLWANDVSRAEYVDEVMDRRGMKKPLTRETRILVWNACEAMGFRMQAERVYSASFARIRLLRLALDTNFRARLAAADHIFVDEAQDLTAADLKVIKACARHAVILVGDSNQSIYQPGFSFRRAGIDISGRARILRKDFRNTVAVHEAAERYRRRGARTDPGSESDAYRDGPAPELFTASDADRLADLLADRIGLFTQRLGFDAGDICVLAPAESDLALVRGHLAARNYASLDVRTCAFSACRADAIRLSTFHAAKGLDFPVVFIYLTRPPRVGSCYSAEVAERLTRNLIYVAMTRTVNNLSVFMMDEPASPALRDLMVAIA